MKTLTKSELLEMVGDSRGWRYSVKFETMGDGEFRAFPGWPKTWDGMHSYSGYYIITARRDRIKIQYIAAYRYVPRIFDSFQYDWEDCCGEGNGYQIFGAEVIGEDGAPMSEEEINDLLGEEYVSYKFNTPICRVGTWQRPDTRITRRWLASKI